MNNIELLEYCQKIYNLPNHYMYGTYGKKITLDLINAKVKQYPNYYTKNRIEACQKALGKYAFDCVGMIKSYYWGGIDNLKYNSSTDVSADTLYKNAKVKGEITTINRNQKGICVHMEGHVGVYDGNGYVYESTINNNAYKIIHSKLDKRGWKHWFECPYVNNIEETNKSKTTNFLPPRGWFKKGDQSQNVAKIAAFMYRIFPAYEKSTGIKKQKILGPLYGDNLIAWIKEFQRRAKIDGKYNDNIDGCLGPKTLEALKSYGFKS